MLFYEHGIIASGIDFSGSGIEVARQRAPGAEFVVGDFREPLPFDEASFDVAFMRGLSTFNDWDIAERAAADLPRIARVVRPGGMLLLSTNTLLSGGAQPNTAVVHHRASTYLAALETVATPTKMVYVDNFLQIAAVHR
jgi:SAM-dependent methyltransferase